MVLLLLAAPLAVGSPATAREPGADCPVNSPTCDVWDDDPGNPGGPGGPGGGDGGGGDGGNQVCRRADGTQIACYDDLLGWYNNGDHCYYKRAEPQPPGSQSGETAYNRSCLGPPPSFDLVFLATPPGGFNPPDPQQLAVDLLASVPLRKPKIDKEPDDGPGLVGLPVWLHDATGWETRTASESAGGVTVTITVIPDRIEWTMGNGDRVFCRDAGIGFDPARHHAANPPAGWCGYAGYPRPSRDTDGGAWTITAIKRWRVPWSSTGAATERGELSAERTATTTVTIDELQVVTR